MPDIHRYTITGEGASPGSFRLVEDVHGAWVTWAEVEAHLVALRALEAEMRAAAREATRLDRIGARPGNVAEALQTWADKLAALLQEHDG